MSVHSKLKYSSVFDNYTYTMRLCNHHTQYTYTILLCNKSARKSVLYQAGVSDLNMGVFNSQKVEVLNRVYTKKYMVFFEHF